MNDLPSFDPPGTLVDIGGRRLHVVEYGEGTPAAVLINTAGDMHLHWHHAIPAVAAKTRTILYDRAGLGWSDPTDSDPTIELIVQDLETLLAALDIDSPVMLVGHSVGAIYARRFAEAHPEQVAGLVLIDPSIENQMSRLSMGEKLTKFYRRQAEFLKSLLDKTHSEIIATLRGNDKRPFEDLPKWLQMKFSCMKPPQIDTIIAEYDIALSLVNTPYEMSSLGDIPLTVLTATDLPYADEMSYPERQQFLDEFQNLHSELVRLSSNGKQIVVEDAGHYMQDDCPDVIANAVEEIAVGLQSGTA